MIWGKVRDNRTNWVLWFAWRPVRLIDGRWAWWHLIERRKKFSLTRAGYVYKLLPYDTNSRESEYRRAVGSAPGFLGKEKPEDVIRRARGEDKNG